MLTVRATKKLLRLTGTPTATDDGTTLLGPWYATVMFWKPRIVLLVNEPTLLPVLLPLAPARTLTTRIADQIATVLTGHNAPGSIIDQERLHMQACRLGTTANRSVVGVMTEFASLAEAYQNPADLVELAIWLSRTPCGPLYRKTGSPDRELAAVLAEIASGRGGASNAAPRS